MNDNLGPEPAILLRAFEIWIGVYVSPRILSQPSGKSATHAQSRHNPWRDGQDQRHTAFPQTLGLGGQGAEADGNRRAAQPLRPPSRPSANVAAGRKVTVSAR